MLLGFRQILRPRSVEQRGIACWAWYVEARDRSPLASAGDYACARLCRQPACFNFHECFGPASQSGGELAQCQHAACGRRALAEDLRAVLSSVSHVPACGMPGRRAGWCHTPPSQRATPALTQLAVLSACAPSPEDCKLQHRATTQLAPCLQAPSTVCTAALCRQASGPPGRWRRRCCR